MCVCVCVSGQQKGSWLWINKANEALKHLSLLSLCGCCCVLIYTRIQTHIAYTQTQMCSTLCRASHFFAATAFNWVEMCKKKSREKNTIERQTETDRETGIGHVDASAHQKGLCCCCCRRCTLYIYLHVDCVSIANWLPGFFHLNCQLLLHWHWHSLAIADFVAGVAWLQVTVSRSHWKGCQSFTLYRAPSMTLTLFFAFSLCVFSKLTVAQIFACAYVSGNFTQTSSAAGHAEWCERTKAGHTSN